MEEGSGHGTSGDHESDALEINVADGFVPDLTDENDCPELPPFPSILCRSICKSYGRHKVLRNLDMTVLPGTIYGLLGPSGCGKTTLINVILGRLKPKTGCLRVFGEIPGRPFSHIPGSDVGYMPQSTALYREMSIWQTLFFHSRLHGMKYFEFKKRKNWLLNFLDLPSQLKTVSRLSGGQQRRVSLAVALLHNPSLLLLDEPTVGVDPLLRKRIWDHLEHLKSQGTTIVLSTHYVEEARRADRVGLMRNGKLLVEDSPQVLLERYEYDNLEDLFLLLCQDQERTKGVIKDDAEAKHVQDEETPLVVNDDGEADEDGGNDDTGMGDPMPVSAFASPSASILNTDDENEVNVKPVAFRRSEYAPPKFPLRSRSILLVVMQLVLVPIFLAVRKLHQLFHSPRLFIFTLVLPSITIFLVCEAIGGDPRSISVAVVNLDRGQVAAAVIEEAKSDDSQNFKFHYFTNQADAVHAVKRNKAWGMVYFPPTFTEALAARCNSSFFDNQTVIAESLFHVRLDQSNQQIAVMIETKLANAFVDWVHKTIPGLVLSGPLVVDDPIYGDRDPKYIYFLAPGMIVQTLYGYSQALTAVSSVRERIDGTMERVFAAGVLPIQVVMGFKLAFSCVSIVQVVPVFLIAFLGFRLPLHGSVIAMIVLCFLLVQCALSFGLLVAAISPGEFEATNTAFGFFLPVMLLSGILWPVEALPIWLKWVAYCYPLSWVAEGMRSIMVRGWGFLDKTVWPCIPVCLGWEFVLVVSATLLIKFRRV